MAIMVCYADDLTIFGDKELIQLVQRQISENLEVTQLQKLSSLLEAKVTDE